MDLLPIARAPTGYWARNQELNCDQWTGGPNEAKDCRWEWVREQVEGRCWGAQRWNHFWVLQCPECGLAEGGYGKVDENDSNDKKVEKQRPHCWRGTESQLLGEAGKLSHRWSLLKYRFRAPGRASRTFYTPSKPPPPSLPTPFA